MIRPGIRPRFLTHRQEEAVVEAITAAEKGNRGEVRVHLEARCKADSPLQRARELYRLMGMHNTRDGTGVLLYVAFKDRHAAVFTGPGVLAEAKFGGWQAVTDAIATGFRRNAPVDGLLSALKQLGEMLRSVVPGEDLHGNELQDSVSQQ